jgi:Predicted periplasmic protein
MKAKSLFFTFLCMLAFAISMNAQQTQTMPAPSVDKKTDALLRGMSDLLSKSNSFTFHTKEMHDKVRPSGKIVQVSLTREVAVRRPDGVWMHALTKASDQSRELNLWYDGKTVTLQSNHEKVYARAKVPPNIDEALDYIGSTLNLPTPMGDVLYSSPYDSFMGPDTSGKYVKLTKIEGKSCHELAFKNPILNWVMWIADGETPLLCKLEIQYKHDYGKPKISMTFLDWNLNAQIAETQFTHVPPADFRRIKIIGRVPLEDSATEQDSKTQTQTQEN